MTKRIRRGSATVTTSSASKATAEAWTLPGSKTGDVAFLPRAKSLVEARAKQRHYKKVAANLERDDWAEVDALVVKPRI